MPVQAGFGVRRLLMAADAAESAFAVRRGGHVGAGNPVFLRLVAVLAGEVETIGGHVHVETPVGIFHGRVEVAMLYRIAAAPVEVANAAVLAQRFADMLGDVEHIGPLFHLPGVVAVLVVGAGGVVTDQAVDLGLVS